MTWIFYVRLLWYKMINKNPPLLYLIECYVCADMWIHHHQNTEVYVGSFLEIHVDIPFAGVVLNLILQYLYSNTDICENKIIFIFSYRHYFNKKTLIIEMSTHVIMGLCQLLLSVSEQPIDFNTFYNRKIWNTFQITWYSFLHKFQTTYQNDLVLLIWIAVHHKSCNHRLSTSHNILSFFQFISSIWNNSTV